MKPAFVDKLIERIGRIRPEDVQNYVLRLAHEKGFLETIFNAIQEGVIVADIEGHISYVNDAACALFGLDREQCNGERLSEKIHGLDWSALAQSERVMSRDVEVFHPQHRFLNFYVVPLSLHERQRGSEELVGYAMILRDITETRRTTEATLESERLSALTLLAAGVAHEIGNPLNSLHIHLQLLERKARKLPAKARDEFEQSLGVAKEEIARLDHIVTQFLRAIRPSSLQLSPESVNTLVRESADFLAPEINDRRIFVQQELRSDLPLLPLDRTQIKQAFYNVIKNACEAMPREGVLGIRTDRDDDFVSITFTDTGEGIGAEQMGKVFQPYQTSKPGGSGLGLLIVRRIVREHGGEIELLSKEGRGLTVTIRLPVRDRSVRLLGAG